MTFKTFYFLHIVLAISFAFCDVCSKTGSIREHCTIYALRNLRVGSTPKLQKNCRNWYWIFNDDFRNEDKLKRYLSATHEFSCNKPSNRKKFGTFIIFCYNLKIRKLEWKVFMIIEFIIWVMEQTISDISLYHFLVRMRSHNVKITR